MAPADCEAGSPGASFGGATKLKKQLSSSASIVLLMVKFPLDLKAEGSPVFWKVVKLKFLRVWYGQERGGGWWERNGSGTQRS